jgi:uncharacterized protein YbbC (DUF1343 family)
LGDVSVKTNIFSVPVVFSLIVAFILNTGQTKESSVVPGIEVLVAERLDLLRGKRLGLITNHTGVDRKLRRNIDILKSLPETELVALFSPEHGIEGVGQAGEKVGSEIDKKSGVPVHSLYGEVTRPTPEMLKDVDLLVYDIQDVGSRYYTYLSTLGQCMEAAAQKSIPFVVLDRPNPLTGSRIEGRVLDWSFRSFVGTFAVPIRYGLSPGELANYVKDERRLNLQLFVVKMKNWQRYQWYDETGLVWVPPSPNIPALESALAYPGMCLLEGTNLSEGRGTTKPFEIAGAPWVDGNKLAERLKGLNLPGVLFRPISFTPAFSKFSGQPCHGIQIHVVDRNQFMPVRTTLSLIRDLRNFYPSQFEWNEKHFDQLIGSDDVRRAIEHNVSTEKIIESWQAGLEDFESKRRKYFLYP